MNLIDRITRELTNARDAATMERASFSFSSEHVIACDKDGKPHQGGNPVQVDEYVKCKVKLYMETWVHAPLVRAIADIDRNVTLTRDIERLVTLFGDQEVRNTLDRIETANVANMKAIDRNSHY